MATQNPYSDSLLMDALRGSLSNAESLGRGFAVAPVGLLGDVNALARQYITPRLPQSVQGLLQAAPAAPTTEQILSNIPRVSAPRRESAGMEQLGAAMNPRGPIELAKAVKNMPVGLSIKDVGTFKFPQEEAMRLAQQRATLPKEQGGLGLLENNTAAERAAAMGFDTPAYHGTASTDIKKFMPEGGTPEGEKTLDWYKNRQANNEPVGYMSFRSGSFFSPKTDYAGHYAPEGAGVMYPVNLRMDNPLNLLPDSSGRYGVTNKPDVNKTIDAMVLQDSIDKSVNEIAIIDPEQIRSRFAAFDPFRKTAATAAAMGVAAPDLLAQEQPVITQQQIDDELARYGLLGR